jgi:hypothetical protein
MAGNNIAADLNKDKDKAGMKQVRMSQVRHKTGQA